MPLLSPRSPTLLTLGYTLRAGQKLIIEIPVVPNLHLGGKLRVTVPSGMSLVSDLPTIEEWMSQGGKEAWYKPGAQMSVRKHTLSSPHGPSADSPFPSPCTCKSPGLARAFFQKG